MSNKTSQKGWLKRWLSGRPVDNDFWLLRAVASIIMLFSGMALLLSVGLLVFSLYAALAEGTSSFSAAIVSLQFFIVCLLAIAFSQLCHAIADIASNLHKLNRK